ncbi:MAG: beta-ketoacyl-ACP synthase III [Opitutaceae bacterium]
MFDAPQSDTLPPTVEHLDPRRNRDRRTIHAAITGVAHWVPEERLTNADFEGMVDTSDSWIVGRTGIRERRILLDPEKGTAYMAAEAAKALLRKTGIDPLSIDLVIVTTATPEFQYPATATIVSDLIGAKRAWSFDLMATCSGFIFALNTARQFVENGEHRRILVIGADKMSTVVDYTDRRTCVLFGDGAGAVLVEPREDGAGVLDARLYADGAGRNLIYQPAGGSRRPASISSVRDRQHYVAMDGRAVFKVAVEKMVAVSRELMERNRLAPEDIAYMVPHQANRRIIEAAANRLDLKPEQVMLNIEKYGNTTTATIPICLCEWENRLNVGDNLLLVTFGAGLTWGGLYVKWAYDSRLGDRVAS